MRDHIILIVVSKFAIPFIVLFALYVQLHGEYSPGGGFQAGVILAVAFVLCCLVYGADSIKKVISLNMLKFFMALGVLIYSSVGILNMFLGGNFLEYNTLYPYHKIAQQIGIVTIELGVGMTVFAAILLIFLVIALEKEEEE